jgi:hypothetical protein
VGLVIGYRGRKVEGAEDGHERSQLSLEDEPLTA